MIKSIEMYVQISIGIGNDCSSLGIFIVSNLFFVQVSWDAMKSWIFVFMPS
jgi:hypothetical protein